MMGFLLLEGVWCRCGNWKDMRRPDSWGEGSSYRGELADLTVAFIRRLKYTKGEWYGKNFDLLDCQEQDHEDGG